MLVTGGAGFIGANLCHRLGREPGIESVVALDDLSTGYASNLDGAPRTELVVGSILDQALVCELVGSASAVVHLAARPSVPKSIADPVASHVVNVDGTLNVLEAARCGSPLPQVIFASSSSVYGANPTLPKHEDLVPRPRSPYAAQKLAGESMMLAWSDSFGLPVLALRFFNVFGPLQRFDHAYAAVVPTFLRAALRSEDLPVFGDGHQTRDFTSVETVSDVLTRAVTRRVASQVPVNLAFGTRTSLLDLIREIEAVVGHPVGVAHFEQRPGDVRDSQADNAVLRSLFPDVLPIPLRTALERTTAWVREAVTAAV